MIDQLQKIFRTWQFFCNFDNFQSIKFQKCFNFSKMKNETIFKFKNYQLKRIKKNPIDQFGKL